MGVLQSQDFRDLAAALASTGANWPFFDGGGTAPGQHIVQTTRPESGLGGGGLGGWPLKYDEYKRTAAATGYHIHTLAGTPGTALRRVRFYFTIVVAPSANTPTIYWVNAGSNLAQIFLATTRTIQLRNVTTAVGVASSALVLGRTYRFEYMNNPAASQQRLTIYEPNETTQTYDSGLVATSATAHTGIRIGNPTSGTLEYHTNRWVEADTAGEIGPTNTWEFGFGDAA